MLSPNSVSEILRVSKCLTERCLTFGIYCTCTYEYCTCTVRVRVLYDLYRTVPVQYDDYEAPRAKTTPFDRLLRVKL